MNKMFTAVAVSQLVEQGKLTFDDTAAHSLPDRAIAGAERIRLHHLLTHTSGLGDSSAHDSSRAAKTCWISSWITSRSSNVGPGV
jgi:CubicO group peptidase (beta-lactamase class C family)